MDTLLSNTDQTKKWRNSFLSNYDIQKIYLNNKNSNNDLWQRELYNKVSYIAISRLKKYKNIYEKDDLLQSMHMSMWKAIKSFDPHKNFDFYRWMSWHMNRCIRDFQNEQRRFCSINLLGHSTSNTINLEDKVILLKDILDCATTISKRDNRIIYSYYFEGLTLAEIGQKEGLSIEGVRKVHNKTIEKFKKKMNLGE